MTFTNNCIRHKIITGGPGQLIKYRWIVLAVGSSVAVGVILLLMLTLGFSNTKCTALGVSEYKYISLFLRIVIVLLPCSVFPFTYYRIRQRQNQAVGDINMPASSSLQTVNTKAGVSVSVLSSLSYLLPQILFQFFPWMQNDIILSTFVWSFRYLQSTFNPVIYYFLYKPYREAFKQLFKTMFCSSEVS